MKYYQRVKAKKEGRKLEATGDASEEISMESENATEKVSSALSMLTRNDHQEEETSDQDRCRERRQGELNAFISEA
jgi:hypothetical protein